MNKKSIRHLAMSGLIGALVLLFTAYLHIPVGKGYIHIGDAFVYLGAVLLPMPYGILAGAVGGALADLLSGYPLWIPATFVIKGLSALFFTAKWEKSPLCPRNLPAPIPAGLLCVGGYYLYESLLYGDYMTPLLSVPGNLIQSLSSGVVFILLAATLKNHLRKQKI